MPVGYVFVGNPGSHVEHNDTALALDIITIPQPTEFFLPGRVPYIKDDVPKVGVKVERVDLDTKSGCLKGSVHELQRVERDDQACGKSAEVCGQLDGVDHLPMYFFSNSPVIWRC